MVGDRFGQSVAGGDLDGDGWSDVVVGAPDFEHGAAGRVYVYRGHADLDDIPDFVLGSTEDGDQFGLELAVADLDGGGEADLAVAAPTNGGRIAWYRGGPAFDTVVDAEAREVSGRRLGYVLAAGEIADDAHVSALLAGMPEGVSDGRPGLAAVRVFGGGEPPPLDDFVDLPAAERDVWFGHALATGCDFDTNGWMDVAVGTAPNYGSTGLSRVQVWFGSRDVVPPEWPEDLVLTGPPHVSRFGCSIGR